MKLPRAYLGIDIETCSALDIDDVATDTYAAHWSTDVHCVVLVLREEGFGEKRWRASRETLDALPEWARRAVDTRVPFVAHNAAFEISVWRHILGPRHDWPAPLLDDWIDTMQIAEGCGLPASLENLAEALGTTGKDAEGKKLMKRLAKIGVDKKTGKLMKPAPSAEQMERLLDYCELDVVVSLECLARMPEPTMTEWAVMRLDRRINIRGVFVDQELAQGIAAIAAQRESQLTGDMFSATGEIIPPTNARALRAWVEAQGVELPVKRTKKDGEWTEKTSLDKHARAELLADDTLDPLVRQALEIREEGSRLSSLAKLRRIPDMVSEDGRLRWCYRYGGAHTGRWSSRGLQLHNLRRVDKALAVKTDALRDAVRAFDAAAILAIHPRLLDVLSQLLRSCVRAAPGLMLVGGDYAAIEARGVAWLAGQDDVLAAFTDPTRDIYVEDAASIGSTNRQLGKLQRLGLGYGMAALKLIDTAKKDGVVLEPKLAAKIVRTFRERNALIKQFWADLEDAFRDAIRRPGRVFHAGRLIVLGSQHVVRIILPSGRAMHYWRPHLRVVEKTFTFLDDEGETRQTTRNVDEIGFWSPGGSGMVREVTYGGSLAENATQAVCRDLLADALLRFDREGWAVVAHTHDSVAAETDGTRSVEEFTACMSTTPSWAAGFPVRVDPYTSPYFKG